MKLGKKTKYKFTYDSGLLEAVPAPKPDRAGWVSLVCSEFTTLCPVTGQPDFARIFVNYVPGDKLVESKSLKLYLGSFRDHGGFHESAVQTVCDDLQKLLNPRYLEVCGEFTPRGGISIWPFASTHNGDEEWAALYAERLAGYAPGKYTMALGRPY